MKIRIGTQWYPLQAGQIERILPNPGFLPVPKAPPGVVGLLCHGGGAVPVLLPEPGCPGGGEGCFAVLLRIPGGALRAVLAEEISGDLLDGERGLD